MTEIIRKKKVIKNKIKENEQYIISSRYIIKLTYGDNLKVYWKFGIFSNEKYESLTKLTSQSFITNLHFIIIFNKQLL